MLPATGAIEAHAIGVGASTGGPKALRALLGALPADYAIPVLVVQHIGADSLISLVRWLDAEIAAPVRVPHHGVHAGPGVWVAPVGRHLRLTPGLRVLLDARRHSELHQPSVDVLLESLAASLGRHAVGVVLSGMGADGARGVSALTSAGGLTVAQDESSSAVFGMPRAAAANGAQALSLDQISRVLLSLEPVRRNGHV